MPINVPTPEQLRRRADELRQSLQRNPQNFAALHELGIICHLLGDTPQAIELLNRAAQDRFADSSVHYNLGVILRGAGQTQRAVDSLRRAIALKPTDVQALRHLAESLQQQGRLDEAIATFRRLLELKPDDAAAHSNLLLCLNYHDAYTPWQIIEEHREFARSHAARGATPPRRAPKHDRIRIGYLSPDFRRHSVAFFLWPILEHHDRSRVDVTCYSDVREPDPVTQILRRFPEHWHNVAKMSDDELAQKIADDHIDILIDLAGHTASNRLPLFATKPAPIQVTYLGYPNTTGLDAVDYRLTDVHADPLGATESLHAEKLIRLPHAFFCYMPPQGCPDVAPLPAAAKNHITFGVFTNFSKVRPNTFRLWAEILRQVPDSRLIVQAKIMDDPLTRDATRRAFTDAGVAAERVDLRGWIDFPRYIHLFADIDIVLDTFPFNGHTTSCHALWMGAAVVTLAGETHRSRMGLSLLTNLNLEELVAHSESDYVRVAVELARDLPQLQTLRQSMRQRMQNSPILDSNRFCRNLEEAYVKMMERQ